MTRVRSQFSRPRILAGVLLAIMLSAMDQMIVASAMPQIVRDLNGVTHMSWVFTAYMLASTITVPIFGKLSDLFGRRGMYLIAIVIFLLGSMMSGAAQSMWQLVLFRWIQGVGGGAMMVSAVATIGDIIPPAERGKYQGYIGAAFGISNVLGPVLGGWISEYFSWRWVFYINLPLGLLALGVLALGLPRVPRVARRSIDYLGAFLLTSSLLPFMLVLVWGGTLFKWLSIPIAGLFIMALCSFSAFIWVERKVKEPIVSLQSFRNRAYLSAIAISFFTTMGMSSAMMVIPMFAQSVLHVTPSMSGMMMVPMMLGMVVASTIAGQITARTGRYKPFLVSGTAMAMVSLWGLSHIGVDSDVVGVMIGMIGLGMGLGSTFPIISMVVQSSFDRSKIGEVTAGVQLFRSLGATVGAAVLGGLYNYHMNANIRLWQDHPFVIQVQKVLPQLGFDTLNGNLIQNITAFSKQMEITAMFQTVAPRHKEWLMDEFPNFIMTVRHGISGAVDLLFLVGAALVAVSVVAAVVIPEIELRRGEVPGAKP